MKKISTDLLLKAGSAWTSSFLVLISIVQADQVRYDFDEEIVVTGTRTPKKISDAPVKTEFISNELIGEYHYKSVDEVLPHLPGVDVFSSERRDGHSAVIQGMGEDRVLVLIDGVPQLQNSFHAFDLSQISTSGIEKIEVVKGASSALYGSQAMGGVVNVITKKPQDKLKYEIDIETGQYENNLLEYRNDLPGSLSLSVAQRISKIGYRAYLSGKNQSSVDRDPNTITQDQNSNRKLDGGALLTYYGSSRDTYSLNYRVFSENIEGVDGSPSPVSGVEKKLSQMNLLSQNVSLSGEKKFTEENRVKGLIFFESLEDDLALDDNPDTPYLENQKTSKQTSGRVELQWDNLFFNRHLVSMGLALTKTRLDQKNISSISENESVVSNEIDQKSQESFQAFIQDDIVFDRWEVVPGVRVQVDPSYGANFSPKTSVRYNTNILGDVKTVVRTSVGTGYRVPSLKERFYFLDHRSLSNYIVIGNESLRPESSVSYQLGSEFIFNSNTSFYLNGFFNDVSNLINTKIVPSLSTVDTHQYVNFESVDIIGAEMSLRNEPLSWLSMDLSYTYSKAENKTSGKLVPFRPTSVGRGVLTFQKRRSKFSLSSIITYKNSQYLDSDNTRKSPGYSTVDFRLNYRASGFSTFYIGVDNALDATRDPASDDDSVNSDLRPSVGRFFYIGFKMQG